MGRIAKPGDGGITKYYWYPGEKSDWVRAGIALGSGVLVFAAIGLVTRSGLWASVLGTAVTAAVTGVTFGRRDTRALRSFSGFAVADTGRAVWRALVKGFGAAAAAILVVNMAERGFWADWVLPVLPAVVGAVAHQAGMLWEQAAALEAPVHVPLQRVDGSPRLPTPTPMPGASVVETPVDDLTSTGETAPAEARTAVMTGISTGIREV